MEHLQSQLKSILKLRFQTLQNANPGYSVRSFAKELGVGSGTLSEFLNGKRKLSEKLITEISDRIKLDLQERSRMLDLKKLGKAIQSNETIEEYIVVGNEEEVALDWQCVAILGLMRLKSFKSSAEWISERLELPEAVIENKLSKLAACQFIAKDENGEWKRTSNRFNTKDSGPSEVRLKAHIESMALAKEFFLNSTWEERDLTMQTFVVNQKSLEKVKILIRKKQREIMEAVLEMNKEIEPDQVYRINMQMFALSTKEESNKSE